MQEFLQRHGASVIGVLSGWDRLLLRGTLRLLANVAGLKAYFWHTRVLWKDFSAWSQQQTAQLRLASEEVLRQADRPVLYVAKPSLRKDQLAQDIARRDKIEAGPICLLTAVEPCWSYELHRSREAKKLLLEKRWRKCLHLYHYQIHPHLGFLHVRLQTWLPFTVKICLNGREWLCRQLDQAGQKYVRRDNCLTWVQNVAAAQNLLTAQLTTAWPTLLNQLAAQTHPGLTALPAMGERPLEYYWSADQSEWATDVMFRSPAALAALYPKLIRQGLTALGSTDVMRFLGQKLPAQGGIHGRFKGEVVSDLKARPEGLRLKHRVNGNSVKVYDKQGRVLRVETTINDPGDFKVWRGTEEKPQKKAWRKMRKGVADLHRRATESQKANARYLSALGAMECPVSLEELVGPLGQGQVKEGRRYRGLRVLGAEDGALLAAVGRGEFALHGFRNGDIRAVLYGPDAEAEQTRRRSGQVSRQLALLRAHGLVRRVPHTRRWLVTGHGRQVMAVLSAAKAASTQELMAKAA